MRLKTVEVLVTLTLVIFMASIPADAQRPVKVPRIGFLIFRGEGPGSDMLGRGPTANAFLQGLRERGYIEGQNLMIEYRDAGANFDRLRDHAADLVHRRVDVIFTVYTQALWAAKSATATIPIVGVDLETDPVESGLVASLARPGGNLTGVFLDLPELTGKWLELLKETVPQASRVAVLWNPANPRVRVWLTATQVAAQALGVQLQPLRAQTAEDFEGVFEAAVRGRAEALIVLPSQHFSSARGRLSNYAALRQIPAIYYLKDFAEAGGLMSYGPNYADMAQRAASLVDKILKGAKPADIPVERAMRLELIINLKTAKALSLTIPPSLLMQATEVIQ
jgi:putative tryptophan/tyrosine transport system substrate-binding protein